jgi:hypothetical protein
MYLNQKILVMLLAFFLGIGLSAGQAPILCSSCSNGAAASVNPGSPQTIYDNTNYDYYTTNYPGTSGPSSHVVTRSWNFWTCPETGSPTQYNKIGVGGAVMSLPTSGNSFAFNAPLEAGCYMAVLTTSVSVTSAAGVTLLSPCVSYACWKICVTAQCPSCNDAFCDSKRNTFPTGGATTGCTAGGVGGAGLCYKGDAAVPSTQIKWYVFPSTTTPITNAVIEGATPVYTGYCFPVTTWLSTTTYPVGTGYQIVQALMNSAGTGVISFCQVGKVDIVQDPTAGIRATP